MLAQDKNTGEKCALKIMKHGDDRAHKHINELFKSEVSAMKELDHPNIWKLVDYSDKEIVTNAYKNQVEISYIAMEYAENGELFDYIAETERFTEQEVRYYFHQIIETLEYLHSNGMAHRDLKPENLLLDSNFDIKFADFGFATKETRTDVRRGTIGYMAPEVLEGHLYDPKQADLFSAAVVLFIMLTQHCPFVKAEKEDKYYKRIIQYRYEEFWQLHSRNSDKSLFTDSFKDLFIRMVASEPSERLTLEEIKNHEWYNGEVSSALEIKAAFTCRKELRNTKKLLSGENPEIDISDASHAKKAISDQQRWMSTDEEESIKLKTQFYNATHGDVLVNIIAKFWEKYGFQFEKSTEFFKVTFIAGDENKNAVVEANVWRKKTQNVRRIECVKLSGDTAIFNSAFTHLQKFIEL